MIHLFSIYDMKLVVVTKAHLVRLNSTNSATILEGNTCTSLINHNKDWYGKQLHHHQAHINVHIVFALTVLNACFLN